MPDPSHELRTIEGFPPPDLWPEIERRAEMPGPRPPRRWAVVLVALLFAGAGIGLAIWSLTAGPEPPPSAISPGIKRIRIGQGFVKHDLVTGDGALWALDARGPTLQFEVVRVDPVTFEIRRYPLGFGDGGDQQGAVGGFAVDGGTLWVTEAVLQGESYTMAPGRLLGFDLDSGEMATEMMLPPGPAGVAVGFGSLWVANQEQDTVSRIDLATHRLSAQVPVGDGPRDIAVGFGSVWVETAFNTPTVARIDPQANEVVAVFQDVQGLSVGSEVWVTDEEGEPNGALLRIDPATNQLLRPGIGLDVTPVFIASADGQVWMARWFDDESEDGEAGYGGGFTGTFELFRFDPQTGEPLTSPITLCRSPVRPVIAFGSLWTTCTGDLVRIEAEGLSRVSRTPTHPTGAPSVQAATVSPGLIAVLVIDLSEQGTGGPSDDLYLLWRANHRVRQRS